MSNVPVIKALPDMEVASIENDGLHGREEGQRLQWRDIHSDILTAACMQELVSCGSHRGPGIGRCF